MTEQERHRKMIQADIDRRMFTAHDWLFNEDEGRIIASLGRFTVIDDDEDKGTYAGDEGELTAMVVGSQEYGNERVDYSILIDEYHDEPSDVDINNVDPV
jgi:hypothetical protein